MPRFRRPCLVCNELGYGTRCDRHQQALTTARESQRNTPERIAKKKALYGGDYRKRRNALVANATYCHICNKPFQLGERIQADHLDAGNPLSPLAPAHATCNAARGSKPLT